MPSRLGQHLAETEHGSLHGTWHAYIVQPACANSIGPLNAHHMHMPL